MAMANNDILQNIWRSISNEIGNISAEWKRNFGPARIWWNNLEPKWKSILRQAIDMVSLEPNEEELAQIVHLQKLDCSETSIINLEPLRQLKYLQELDVSSTNIVDLEPLRMHSYLIHLNCFNTKITSIKPLKNLLNLRSLNLQMTDIETIAPLTRLSQLQELNITSTYVKSLYPIRKLKRMQALYCKNTPLTKRSIRRFRKRHPEATAVSDWDERLT